MTPFGVRSLSRPAVTAESHTRVATLGRVFHQVGPFEFSGSWVYNGAIRGRQNGKSGFDVRPNE
jgi:hypothetical protein